MEKTFPRTIIGGVSVSRLVIGTNWFLGYSHTTSSQDKLSRSKHENAEYTASVIQTFMKYGIDTIMGPFNDHPHLCKAAKIAEDKTGKKLIIIDTPVFNVNDSNEARKEAENTIKHSKQLGATFCLPHHTTVEKLVNKNKEIIERLPDYLKMIRDNNLIPGLSCHMPELVVYSDKNGYDVETYIQIYNCLGFLMQIEIEYTNKIIWNAKKPVITIKPMAAGRVTPFVGLTFVWNTIRECDLVTTGCLSTEEAEEIIEISFACLERRIPNLEGRNSPVKTAIMPSK